MLKAAPTDTASKELLMFENVLFRFYDSISVNRIVFENFVENFFIFMIVKSFAGFLHIGI